MRSALITIILFAAMLCAEDVRVCLYGDSGSDFSIYVNTASMEKKMEPKLYAQMMDAAKKVRLANKDGADLPFSFMGRDWEVVANVRLLPGEFTFLVDGIASVTGGFQKEIDSFARIFGESFEVMDYELEGIAAKRFLISEVTVKQEVKVDKDEEEETEVEEGGNTSRLSSLDLLLASLAGSNFQFYCGVNTPLQVDTLRIATPGENNIFLYDDLLLAAYLNIPRLLPLVPSSPGNTKVMMLRAFLAQLSYVVISFQPDERDLVLRARLAFVTEEQAQAMKTPIEQNVNALIIGMKNFVAARDVSCVTEGKICDIALRIDILEASKNLNGIMRRR